MEAKLAKQEDAQAKIMQAKRYLNWSKAGDVTVGSHGILALRPWVGFY